jgi:hypothetical protein
MLRGRCCGYRRESRGVRVFFVEKIEAEKLERLYSNVLPPSLGLEHAHHDL